MTGVIDAFEKADTPLVMRNPSSLDRRKYFVKISDAGRDLLTRLKLIEQPEPSTC